MVAFWSNQAQSKKTAHNIDVIVRNPCRTTLVQGIYDPDQHRREHLADTLAACQNGGEARIHDFDSTPEFFRIAR